MDDYPPEFDGPDFCLVCGKDVSGSTSECKCPECPECAEVGAPECYELGHMSKGNRAFDISDLAKHLGVTWVENISKRLFNDTECGISFEVEDYRNPQSPFTLAGYAEVPGNAYCQPIELSFPIDLDEFDEAVKRADREGCDLWNEFHCATCGGETGHEEPCEECDQPNKGHDKMPTGTNKRTVKLELTHPNESWAVLRALAQYIDKEDTPKDDCECAQWVAQRLLRLTADAMDAPTQGEG